jgi:hypothetical protein
MRSDEASVSEPSEPLGAQATFAYAFAAFLRQNEEAWRMRRVDRFRPFDLHLAERTITLQGQIDAELLEQFFELEDPSLRRAYEQRQSSSRLTVYVPVIAHQKRLHLDFCARNQQGHVLPVVNRFQSAGMTAVHLMAALLDPATRTEDLRRLFVVLMALAFQMPTGFEGRIRHWAKDGAEAPLVDSRLLDWVEWEGSTFLPGLGKELRREVDQYLHPASGGTPPVPDFSLKDVASLEHYTIRTLLLHGIRDVLKTLVWLAPPVTPGEPQAPPGREQRRKWLTDRTAPSRLATLVSEIALKGLDLLLTELHRAKSTPKRMLYTELPFWRSYVPTEITLGAPFIIEISETYWFAESLSYPRQLPRFFRGSWQWYPLPIKDAQGVHLEIEVPDPALHVVPERTPGVVPTNEPGRLLRFPLNLIFGSVFHASERTAHLYSSRMRSETPQHDDSLLRYVRARFKVRLRPSILLGHLFAAIGAVFAAIYVGYSTVSRAIHLEEVPIEDLRVVATVGALSLTISLWLTAIQHPRPITFKTLAFPRLVLYLALFAIIASFAIYGVSWVYAHHWRRDPAPSSGLPHRLGVEQLAVRRIGRDASETTSGTFLVDLRSRRAARLAL